MYIKALQMFLGLQCNTSKLFCEDLQTEP